MQKKTFFQKAKLLFVFALLSNCLHSQVIEPVEWSFSKEKIDSNKYELVFSAEMDEGWSIYGTGIESGGPIAASIDFEEHVGYRLVGKKQYPDAEVKYDPNFDMEVPLFSGNVAFRQVVEVISEKPVNVKGELVFMACDDSSCLPPDYIDFSFSLDGVSSKSGLAGDSQLQSEFEPEPEPEPEVATTEQEIDKSDVYYETSGSERKGSVWWNFILGFMGGLLALLTPCVFPMIPLTVSFFIRNAGNRPKALRDALFYGFSIIFIYVVVGIFVSVLFGADRLNAIATSPGFNLFFFVLLVFFAASFFGAFELRLPSGWANKLDNKVNKTGGLVSVFLMGVIFVLVSFSCTGPIVGTLLVEAALSQNILAPALGMAGFSVALAIPFSLFAVFPGILDSLPKSGGWMNTIKVVLGFIVLAFSLKFFAIADAVGQWDILSRDIFIVIWMAVFFLMGLYLIGVMRFVNDNKQEYLSVPRLFFAIAAFAFAFYLLPGLFGAPLKSVSYFMPPMTTQNVNIFQPSVKKTVEDAIDYKGESVRERPHGLMAFTDYEEGMMFARKKQKPVLVDFTGLGCTNCRKMEAAVWSDDRVLKRLQENFIKISLFVDDRTRLPEDEQFISTTLGRERRIRTIGQKWSVFQAEKFNINTQPYYVILDHDENMIAEPFGYDTNIEKYIKFLDKGYNNFQQLAEIE